MSDSAGVLARHQTYYWNGSSYAATDNYGFGQVALQNNTGANSNGFGYSALQNNTGANSNGFGYAALRYNTGANSNGFGQVALQNNTGAYSNGFGYSALNSNTGTNSNGFGYAALNSNTGAYSNGFGQVALQNNTGANSNGFGYSALQNNNWADAVAIGHQAGMGFTANAATAKAFTDAEVDGSAHTITIGAGHGFGSSGKINLLFTTTAGTAPTGLTTGTVYQFTITSTTVLTYSAITTAGSADFEGKLENSIDTSNTIVIGKGVNATKANQVVLGPSTITETVLRGALALTMSSILDCADDAAAATAGVAVGTVYRNGSVLMVRVS
jgi:hypothetical protein